MKYLFIYLLLLTITGCSVGHQPWVDFHDEQVGKTTPDLEIIKFKNAGKLVRADFLIEGDGLTHITKDKEGNLILHWSIQEVLPTFRGSKEWVGKCLMYEIVDVKTHIIKSWGYEEEGNPLSCRSWP